MLNCKQGHALLSFLVHNMRSKSNLSTPHPKSLNYFSSQLGSQLEAGNAPTARITSSCADGRSASANEVAA